MLPNNHGTQQVGQRKESIDLVQIILSYTIYVSFYSVRYQLRLPKELQKAKRKWRPVGTKKLKKIRLTYQLSFLIIRYGNQLLDWFDEPLSKHQLCSCGRELVRTYFQGGLLNMSGIANTHGLG